MIAVTPVSIFTQLQQVVPHLAGGLPQPLLLLPALPTIQSRCTKRRDNQHRNQGFEKRVTLLFFHVASMA